MKSITQGVVGALLLALLLVGCDRMESPTTQNAKSTNVPALAKAGVSWSSAWAASGTGTVTLISDGTTAYPSMSYYLSGSVVWNPQTWQFSATATEAKTVTLPFHYVGFHAWFQVRVWVVAFVNGTTYPLISQGPVNCCTPPSGGFDLTGSVTLTLAPGDVFGFRFGGENFDSDARLLGTFSVVQPVTIDIKPGSNPNSINCQNPNAVIPVAILSTATFDATTVDHTTVTFQGASEMHTNQGLPTRHVEDVDGDGDMDLVFHFRLSATDLTCSSTVGMLTGLTYAGVYVEGSDAINMVNQ